MARCLLASALILGLVSARAVSFEKDVSHVRRDDDKLPTCALQCYNNIGCSDANLMKSCISKACSRKDDLHDAMDFLEDDCDNDAFDHYTKQRDEIVTIQDGNHRFSEANAPVSPFASFLAARITERNHLEPPHQCAVEELGCGDEPDKMFSCLCSKHDYYYGVHDCIVESCPEDAQEYGLAVNYAACEIQRSETKQQEKTSETDHDYQEEEENDDDSHEEEENDDDSHEEEEPSSGGTSEESFEDRSLKSRPFRPWRRVYADAGQLAGAKRQGVVEDISPPGEWAEGASGHHQSYFTVHIVSLKDANSTVSGGDENQGEQRNVVMPQGSEKLDLPTSPTAAPSSSNQMRKIREVLFSPTDVGTLSSRTKVDYVVDARETDPAVFPSIVPRTGIAGLEHVYARQGWSENEDFAQAPEDWKITQKLTCEEQGQLRLNLVDARLFDQFGRRGYVADNGQIQFDDPPQSGAIFTSGFNMVDGTLALGPRNVFYSCGSGGFVNIYDRPIADYCEASFLRVADLTQGCST